MVKRLRVTPQQDQESLELHSDTAPSSDLNPVKADKAKEKGDNMPNQIASLVEKMLKEQVHQKEIGTDRADSGRGEGVSLSIWDFAGHDIYYSTHQVFLTWRAIYVIVFDLSRSLDSVVPPESRGKNYEMLVALRTHITKVAMEEPYMGEEIPLRWLLFEEALAADKLKYMSLDQVRLQR
eukprot:XP_011684087.1 PREDICTED: uncharacterized protein LOC105447565 [Strongylocentrotus purpuratus]